jgi:hypothetical protein
MRPRTALDIFVLWLEPERILRDIIITIHWCSFKVPVILVRVQSNLNSAKRFSKNTFMPIFMEIRPLGAELFHADRLTDTETDSPNESNSHFFSQFFERT